MNKLLGFIILMITFITQADNNWLNKYIKTKTFTYGEFLEMIDDNNQDSYQKLIVGAYYIGIVNGTRSITAIAEHEHISTLYCIPSNKSLSPEEYILFMKLYYLSLNIEQQKIVAELPVEIVHLRTLKNIYPCKSKE